MSYTHITEIENFAIEFYLKEWLNFSEIARELDRNPSTIIREVERYKSKKTWKYNAKTAIKLRKEKRSIINKQNKQRIKQDKNSEFLTSYILSKIKKYWSPEQISWRLKLEENITISKDTIYKYIYEEHYDLVKKYFRRKWKKYQHKRREKYQLSDRKMIEKRNEKYKKEIENRNIIWHWEWDTIIWKRLWSKQVILTNVERKSLYLLARKIENKSGNAVLEWSIFLFKIFLSTKRKL